MFKRFFSVLIILLAVGIAIIFRPELENIFLQSKNKLADFSSGTLGNIVENIEDNVSTPPPLRHADSDSLGNLTQSGTINLTNAERKNNGGLGVLSENSKLDQAATLKAKDILAKQYFDHISPDGKGPTDLAKNVNYDYIAIGENLALGGFASDKELVDAWMASPGHRENILNKAYTEIGVAVVKGIYEKQEVWVAVQEFGTPTAVCPQVDETLKAQIDASQKQIDSLLQTLNATRKELTSSSAKTNSDYSGQVSAYNKLVADYNSLTDKTKVLVEKYNSQVNNLNDCIKKYK
ncbi:MAG: CAP domain-containing protein [Parcubacteria group bacterium]|jgi:uncharacterized protein YkwD